MTREQDRLHLVIRSQRYMWHHDLCKKVEVQLRFAPEDWDMLCDEAKRLGHRPEQLLETRIKLTIRRGTPTARVEHAYDRRRLADDYAAFWMPYLKYLIYAHLWVLAAGAAMEFLLGTGREYVVFYWTYALSLLLALLSISGLKMKQFYHRSEDMSPSGFFTRLEVKLAKVTEALMWLSVLIFATSLLGRIALGMYHSAPYVRQFLRTLSAG